MAVGPKRLLEELSTEAQAQMTRLEELIDQYVETHFEGGRVCVPMSEYPKAHVAEKLKEKYRAAGWTSAKFDNDQRDGSWLELVYDPAKNAEDYYGK